MTFPDILLLCMIGGVVLGVQGLLWYAIWRVLRDVWRDL